MKRLFFLIAAAAMLMSAADASADCRNNFLNRPEGSRQVVTLLTGKLTFQEAQDLAAEIMAKKKAPIAWLDSEGRVVARQFGELKVVRPMPVKCDGKPSGVVVIVTFPTLQKPVREMVVKFDEGVTVVFAEQG